LATNFTQKEQKIILRGFVAQRISSGSTGGGFFSH
jgi:hypothetical protein